MIRRIGAAVLTVTCSLTAVRAFPPPPARPTAAKAEDLNAILSDWAENSSRIKTLSAQLSRNDRRPLLGSMNLIYDFNWKDTGQAVVIIKEAGHKKGPNFVDRIVWTGQEVWQFNPRKKEVEVYTKDRLKDYEVFRAMILTSGWGRFVGNQFDFIFPALGNPKEIDPLPFFVGMKATLARKSFRFELVDDGDPDRLVVRATPLSEALKQIYDHVLITLDRERHLPVAVEYQRGWRGRDTRHYTLVAVKLDQPINDDLFVAQKPNGWKFKTP
ncbi:MAG TPA: hypothetical protein VHX68_04690 [Planctomycetaceae bacterium]|nr:hypothetical protein [Planctomycetaceae bacterium]